MLTEAWRGMLAIAGLSCSVLQATFKGWIDIMKHATDIKDVCR